MPELERLLKPSVSTMNRSHDHASSTRRLRPWIASGLLVALPVLMGAEDTQGGCTLAQDTLKSPIQAVSVLTERSDGVVEADLVVISTRGRQARYVTSVSDAEVRTPTGELVALTQTQDGHYTASSVDHPGLTYDASGTNYRITFEIDDEDVAGDAAGSEFIAVVAPPDEQVDFELTKAPEFAGDTASIAWSPARLDGLLEVRNEAGDVVFSTFDWQHPEFDGSKWASLIRGGDHDLRVDVFAEPGTYTLSFCAVESREGFDEEVSGGLGVFSGFLAGRCVDDVVLEVAP